MYHNTIYLYGERNNFYFYIINSVDITGKYFIGFDEKKKMTTNEVYHDLENSSENATEKESSKKDKNQDHSNTVTNDSLENEFHDAVDNFPIDNDLIENEGSIDDYDEVATDNVSTKPIEGCGNNRDDVDASKHSKSKRIPSTTNITNIVREIINSMIGNISDKTTDQTGDNLVHISSKNDILNDLLDDDSSYIDPEMYAVASKKLTTSIDNALSLQHKLHLKK